MRTAILAALLSISLASIAAAAVPPELADSARQVEAFPATRGQGSESERLKRLFDLRWELQMHASPETATFVGYPGLNDRWSDASPESIEFGRRLTHKMLQALDSIDRSRLAAAEQVHYDLLHRKVEQL